MKYAALSLVVYSTMVAQTSVLCSAIPASIRMAAVTAIAVGVAGIMTDWRGVVLAASIGLLSDLTSSGPIGTEMFLAAMTACSIQLRTEPSVNFLQTALTTFAGVFLIRLVVTIVDQFEAGISGEPLQISLQTLMAASFFAIVVPLFNFGWQTLAKFVSGDALPASSTPTDRWLASTG